MIRFRLPFFLSSFVLLFCLSACATPRAQTFEPAQSAPRLEEKLLMLGGKTTLPVHSWLPEGAPKAVIVALHGFNDYSHAFELYTAPYDGPAPYLAARGIAVYAYDQRGFGRSEERGIWAGEENLVHDLRQMVLSVKARYPHTPLYILGESMGGAVAIVALSDPSFPSVDGLILSAPAVWGSSTLNGFYRAVLWAAAHMVPDETLTGNHLKIKASSNILLLRAIGRDPLVIKETRIDSIYGLVSLMDDAFEKAPLVHTPLLLLYGKKDEVIPPGPIAETLPRLTAPHRFVHYPQGYHMLLRDIERETVLEDIIRWISHPAAPLPSGYEQQRFE